MRKITEDMKYMDKKYGSGTTNDICANQKGGVSFGLKEYLTKETREEIKAEKNLKETGDLNKCKILSGYLLSDIFYPEYQTKGGNFDMSK